jgi:general secretion pathway protein G
MYCTDKYHNASSGYSLLELLVVLLFFSLLAGITIPRLANMYDSVQVAFERDEVFANVSELGYLTFRQSRDFILTNYSSIIESETNDEPSLLQLPEGWQIRVVTPILFRANGACSGGILQLQYRQQQFKVQLKSPFCQPELIVDNF